MKFILADHSYEEQLRNMVRDETMPGHIQISYEREPDFFHGLETQGTFNQIMAAEEEGRIIGFGCRSIRPVFLNGKRINFGYLSGLRSLPESKQKLGVVRGYRTLKKLHTDGRCPGYITTIIDGNVEAISTITKGRAGLPSYKKLGRCTTYAIPLKMKRDKTLGGLVLRFAKKGEEKRIMESISLLGKQYQFFPALAQSDFESPLLLNLSITDFIVAEKEGKICGISALWDQSAFKQHRIRKYSGFLRRAKPLLNTGLKCAGCQPIPNEGEMLRQAFFCFKATTNNDPKVMKAMLDFACKHLAHAGYAYCITGFHDDDPCSKIVKKHHALRYRSHLYFSGWADDLKTYDALDHRVFNFEPAIL